MTTLTDRYTPLFDNIAERLRSDGYAIIDDAFDPSLAPDLLGYAEALRASGDMQRAGIGRGDEQEQNTAIRKDRIHWLSSDSAAPASWLPAMEALRLHLNRRLFLGLFSYESHIAHYSTGDFYKKHLDAFRGEANRILSTVYYLNPDWLPENGGELAIFDEQDQLLQMVAPVANRLVIFLSEEFPHEVRPARADRYSIAGWFRLNSTHQNRIDPPR